jgi:hypothetical protein
MAQCQSIALYVAARAFHHLLNPAERVRQQLVIAAVWPLFAGLPSALTRLSPKQAAAADIS